MTVNAETGWSFIFNDRLLVFASHLLSCADAAAAQSVDVVATLVHEAADQPVVAEDDAGHLGDVLVALVVADVAAVIHQAGHQVALPQLLRRTFFNLNEEHRQRRVVEAKTLGVILDWTGH